MTTINATQYGGAFDQLEIEAMSFVLDDVCKTMHVRPTARNAREAIAERIVDLATRDGVDPARLKASMLRGWRQPEAA